MGQFQITTGASLKGFKADCSLFPVPQADSELWSLNFNVLQNWLLE
jgi:hypothetical protein